MFKKSKVSAAVALTLGGALAMTGLAAHAQSAERVEVTGSRIKSIQSETASPVVSLGAEAIRVEGVRNIETLLNNLPQVFADQGAQVSNGATGTATVNLRNLGSSRTLVLVNGRRLPAGSPLDVAADLTQIPIGLIKRVDLLFGGASAVYGSDAVAGVVNFILNDNFSGLQIDLNTQFYNHSQRNGVVEDAVRARNFPLPGNKSADGQVNDLSILVGGNFDSNKGNATLFFGYKKEQALLQSERDFSACALAYNRATGKFTCGGSGTSYPGRFTDLATFDLTIGANGAIRNYVGATDAYNYAPLNYFQRPSERFIFNASAHYDISDKARTYTELSWMDNRTVAQIAPSGIFGTAGTGGNFLITARNENPLITPAFKTALGITAPGSSQDLYIFRRNVEGGGRQDDKEYSSYRSVVGVQGDVGPWSYDVYGQYGKVLYQQTYFNDFSNTRILRATDVVTGPNGTPVCRSVIDGSDPNCVPYNIWSIGGVTPAALAYLQIPLFSRGYTQQSVASANLTADLSSYGLKSPWAATGVNLSAGFEHRNEKLVLNTDANFSSGDGAGQGGPTIGLGGAYSVNDVFGEIKVPLMQKMPFAEYVSVNGSYRRSDYSTGQKTNTFGLGLEYMPVSAVKFRGSYQRAARAANVIELFSAQSIGLYDNAADPCAGATPLASQAACANTGVTAAQYGRIADSPARQYNQITGGNTTLKPETSNSYTVGVVLSPVRDLSLTLDYFSYKIDDVINSAPSPQILANCLATGAAALCSLIHRDSAGTLWASPNAYILSTNANLSVRKTNGFDVGVDYRLGLPSTMGKLDFNFLGVALRKFESVDFPGSGSYDCAGLYGDTCGTPAPKWRHKFRTTWQTPWNASVAFTWRYLKEVNYEGDSSNAVLANPTGSRGSVAQLGARDYFDLALAYTFTKNFSGRVFVNNIFDRDPPIRTNGSGFVNGNTYPVVYDALGRKVGLTLTAMF